MTVTLFVIMTNLYLQCQADDFRERYDQILLDASDINNLNKIDRVSVDGNTKNFAHLGFFVDANNTMFLATGDKKYFDYNFSVAKNVWAASILEHSYKIWYSRTKLGHTNHVMNNKEHQLYEGYLFRYLASFCYYAHKSELYSSDDLELLKLIVEETFMKWYTRSIEQYGDDSLILTQRTHMGSHWAEVALFMSKVTKNAKYLSIYNKTIARYNQALKNNFKIVFEDNIEFYQWNSTWDDPNTKFLKTRLVVGHDKPTIQDVSHGSHVIQYILSAHSLGMEDWDEIDVKRLASTFKLKIGKGDLSFPDNIDGTSSNSELIQGSGWRLATGWMKLIHYDRSIYPIFKSYYERESTFINDSILNLGFYSQLYSYIVQSDR